MPNMEQIVRPFQTTSTIVNKRLNVTRPTKLAPQKAIILWGAEGQAPEVRGLTIDVRNSDNRYREQSRTTDTIRIENPDDSSQFIITQQMNNVKFTKPAASAPSNNSGASGGAPDSVAFSAGATPPLIPSPTVTTGSTVASRDEVHSFTLTQQI